MTQERGESDYFLVLFTKMDHSVQSFKILMLSDFLALKKIYHRCVVVLVVSVFTSVFVIVPWHR